MRPYARQYESSDKPYPKSVIGWIVWLLFFAPGIFLLWVGYMWPARGKVWVSQRRAENKIMQVLYTFYFYLLLPFVILAVLIWLPALTTCYPHCGAR